MRKKRLLRLFVLAPYLITSVSYAPVYAEEEQPETDISGEIEELEEEPAEEAEEEQESIETPEEVIEEQEEVTEEDGEEVTEEQTETIVEETSLPENPVNYTISVTDGSASFYEATEGTLVTLNSSEKEGSKHKP